MNAQIARLFGFIVVLFALLLIWTSRWTVIDAATLDNNPLNRLTLIHQLTIQRGRILADDGSVLARSVPAGGGTWKRAYPTGPLFAQAIGYSNIALGSAAGMERSYGPALRGLQTGLGSVFGQLSPRPVGDEVLSHLDPKAQRVAQTELAGRAGAVVALNPQTGAVKVMYSNPSYDDNHPNPNAPGQFNKATQAGYPPGSTFKVVTATAAIDSGKYTPNSIVNGKSPVTISGVPLNNDLNQSFGPIDLTTALTYSVNTVWAQVAESLGTRDDDPLHEALWLLCQAPAGLPPGRAQRQPALRALAAVRTPPEVLMRTSAASPSARAACSSRPCRWPWSPRPWPTAASS